MCVVVEASQGLSVSTQWSNRGDFAFLISFPFPARFCNSKFLSIFEFAVFI